MIMGFSLGEWCEFYTLLGISIVVFFLIVILFAVYQRKKLRDMQLSGFTFPLVLSFSITIGIRVAKIIC